MAPDRAIAETRPGPRLRATAAVAVANDAPALEDPSADSRFDRFAAQARSGERRALRAVGRLADEVARLGEAIDARLQRSDSRAAAELTAARAELAQLEAMVVRRLRVVEAGQAAAVESLRAEMSVLVERLSERMARAEGDAAEAAAGLGRRLDEFAAQAKAGEARLVAALDARLEDNRRHTDRLVGDLRGEIFRRDASLTAYVDAAVRRPSTASILTSLVLVIAGGAGALSLTAAGLQIVGALRPQAPAGAVRLPLPLRPTLPAELTPSPKPPAAPPALAPGPAPARSSAPAPAPGRSADFVALAQAIARGDRPALDQIRALAQGGAPVAQLLLAKLYESGQAALPRDLGLARQWTERAAQGGERAAMHNLAVYMMNGEGGPADPAGAARWFEKAAEAGVVDAQFNLGLLYENGRGVAKNLVEAYRWYAVAAGAGDGLARGRAVALEPRLTPRERAEAAGQADAFHPGQPPAPALPVTPPAGTVADSQKLLAREGYFIGRTDGSDSAAYRTAVAAYLHDHPQAAHPVLAP